MIDTSTNERLCVEGEKGVGSDIMLPLSQLNQVTALLDANQIPYEVDEESLSVDGQPTSEAACRYEGPLPPPPRWG